MKKLLGFFFSVCILPVFAQLPSDTEGACEEACASRDPGEFYYYTYPIGTFDAHNLPEMTLCVQQESSEVDFSNVNYQLNYALYVSLTRRKMPKYLKRIIQVEKTGELYFYVEQGSYVDFIEFLKNHLNENIAQILSNYEGELSTSDELIFRICITKPNAIQYGCEWHGLKD